jgi:hypothetical protein
MPNTAPRSFEEAVEILDTKPKGRKRPKLKDRDIIAEVRAEILKAKGKLPDVENPVDVLSETIQAIDAIRKDRGYSTAAKKARQRLERERQEFMAFQRQLRDDDDAITLLMLEGIL